MTDHTLYVEDIRHVKVELSYENGELGEEEIVDTQLLDNSMPMYSCSCGREEMSLTDALDHMGRNNA